MVGLVILFFVVILFRCIAPDQLMPKLAKAALSSGDWAQLTGKDKELELKITALESKINELENKPCSCQATGIDNSGLNQRVDSLEAESRSQKSLLDSIYQMLLKLFSLLTQVLIKLK